tara:strand:- start:131 stop:538 length:408 start_codon:yes stop_codon:yes gene_type:complete
MKLIRVYLALVLLITLSACHSTGSKIGSDILASSEISEEKSTFKILEDTNIVHVDNTQRIVTLKSNDSIEDGYYITLSPFTADITSTLKIYNATYGTIYIGDILDGRPKINDSVAKVSPSRNKELNIIYSEVAID